MIYLGYFIHYVTYNVTLLKNIVDFEKYFIFFSIKHKQILLYIKIVTTNQDRIINKQFKDIFMLHRGRHKIFIEVQQNNKMILNKIVVVRRVSKIAKSDYYLRHVQLSVCLSVHMEHLCCHCTDFNEIWYSGLFFENLIKIWKNEYFARKRFHFFDNISLFHIKLQRKSKHTFYVDFSRKSCRLWDNVNKYGGAREATNDITKWRITRFTLYKQGYTHAHACTGQCT